MALTLSHRVLCRFIFTLCEQTGMYYLRTKPAVNAIQYTVDKSSRITAVTSTMQIVDDAEVCLSCQS
jgi:ribonucleoside-diphosphate reductase subunit M1